MSTACREKKINGHKEFTVLMALVLLFSVSCEQYLFGIDRADEGGCSGDRWRTQHHCPRLRVCTRTVDPRGSKESYNTEGGANMYIYAG